MKNSFIYFCFCKNKNNSASNRKQVTKRDLIRRIVLKYRDQIYLIIINLLKGLKKEKPKQMGYNSNCSSQYCYLGCCDQYGYCPSYSSSCYYYYTSSYTYTNTTTSSTNIGGIIGGSVGGFLFLVFTIIAIVLVVRRFRQNRAVLTEGMNTQGNGDATTMIIVNDPNNPAYGQPVNNSYPYNNNSPIVYNNPPPVYNQPIYQVPNSYPYQTPQPAYYNTSQQPIIIA